MAGHHRDDPAVGRRKERISLTSVIAITHKRYVISTEGGAFAAVAERPLYFVVAAPTPPGATADYRLNMPVFNQQSYNPKGAQQYNQRPGTP
jgi:hypothetical protein